MYKALIVDDERIIRQGIRMVVPWERLGIGEVFMASSGQEALGIFKEERPDIMITDIRMTEVTGLELISQIRELNEDLKIIVLTGYDSFEYARECLRMRVDEFLLKPVDEEYLIQTIQKLVTILDETKEKEVVEKRMSRIKGTAEQSRLEGVMNDFIMNREVPEKICICWKNSMIVTVRHRCRLCWSFLRLTGTETLMMTMPLLPELR